MLVRYIERKENGRRLNPLDNSEFHNQYIGGKANEGSHRISLNYREAGKSL